MLKHKKFNIRLTSHLNLRLSCRFYYYCQFHYFVPL